VRRHITVNVLEAWTHDKLTSYLSDHLQSDKGAKERQVWDAKYLVLHGRVKKKSENIPGFASEAA
jgi:hypothetical protein